MSEARTCKEILRDYHEALECVKKFTEKPELTDEEREQWLKCMDDLKKYGEELRENDCR